MAVWGTPIATEDDAERAVRAALDLVAAVSALGDEVGAPELRARAGVLTGEAAVTIGAEGQGMVAGDLVNTASRIQSAAEPGTVLVGESTRRATEAAIAYEDAGAHELKGKDGLDSALAGAARRLRACAARSSRTGLEAPFVGRDRELRQIKDLFHACADEGKAHLVSVTGIAGIGKSRLAWEFYKYFDGLADTVYWHRGRCLAYGEGVTYWALADMVRMRCRIAEEEDAGVGAREAARDARGARARPGGARLRRAAARAAARPRTSTQARDQQDLFAAWRLFFERLADELSDGARLRGPAVGRREPARLHRVPARVVAQPPDLRGHARAARAARAAADLGRRAAQLHARSTSSRSRREAMEELLAGLVPGPARRTLRDQILARAEGIPLYAVETVRMLLDRGLLVQEGAVYRPTGRDRDARGARRRCTR